MSELLNDYSLTEHNAFALSVNAPYCMFAESRGDIEAAVANARELGLRLFVLGDGSNVVLNDLTSVLVLVMQLTGMEVLEDTPSCVRVRVAAGESWHRFVLHAHQKKWFGIENLALIPGTVGAAPVQNVGAYGVEVASLIESVEVLDERNGSYSILSNADCEFAYRDSIFKSERGQHYIICSVTFRFDRMVQPNWSYPALKAEIETMGATGRAFDILKAVISIREAKLPDPKVIPNVGSFFKNPILSNEEFEALRDLAPMVAHWSGETSVKVSAAWLVEHAGWKGHKRERVGVHTKQSLVLINLGGATAADVLLLASDIQESVREQYGVELEIEPAVI